MDGKDAELGTSSSSEQTKKKSTTPKSTKLKRMGIKGAGKLLNFGKSAAKATVAAAKVGASAAREAATEASASIKAALNDDDDDSDDDEDGAGKAVAAIIGGLDGRPFTKDQVKGCKCCVVVGEERVSASSQFGCFRLNVLVPFLQYHFLT
jgi:hypothetical protein